MTAKDVNSVLHRWHRLVAGVWPLLRALSGDAAYDRYAAHALARHPGQSPLTRREFYDAELRRKWSGINRCC